MRVRLWGTRGSVAKPGSKTLRYGGNTSCVEVRADDGTLVILDCGTGIHDLGGELAKQDEGHVGHLLIGHTHWDHIQGFPFFDPLFAAGNRWGIYAPGQRRRQIESILSDQMAYEYSPIDIGALKARVRFHDLREGSLDVGGIRVTTQYLNHPALAIGYRLEADGATLVYATDHEPYSLHPLGAPPGIPPLHREDQRHVRFLEGADLVIHDAQYTIEEFPEKSGWGHTPVERAVDYAVLAGAKRLALFHHDPRRDDAALDRIEALGRERVHGCAGAPEVFVAAEGRSLELTGKQTRPRPPIAAADSALISDAPRPGAVLVVEDDPDMLRLLEATLRSEGVEVVAAPDGASALSMARECNPSLILLDVNLPDCNGMDLCRRLRAEPQLAAGELPILILTGAKLKETDLVEGFGAGATDYLTKPIKPTLVRSRVRQWLLRTRPHQES
jgi:CheY-like chemotaxis protein/phosphoribosyl 1,2-cyclic phosphodiesterase